ncbi:MAG: hypothetical protein ACR2N1_09810 [Rubripirellula sp.]
MEKSSQRHKSPSGVIQSIVLVQAMVVVYAMVIVQSTTFPAIFHIPTLSTGDSVLADTVFPSH